MSAAPYGGEPLVHQIETVRKVLKQFRGRVLLADEVGLGKTIEAGMVLKEYALRGMAERILVLTPASLVGQRCEELATKFGLTFATTYDPLLRDDSQAFWTQNRIVASIAIARRREHAERLIERQFDLIIVDEAHHLRDRSSQSSSTRSTSVSCCCDVRPVVGEVGAILDGLEEEREFPDLVLDAWLGATEAARQQAFDALGHRLGHARQQHENAKALDEKLFGEDFEAA